jgi:hypothetical protein
MTDKSATPLTFEQAEYKARLDGDRAAIQVIDELKRELAACQEELKENTRLLEKEWSKSRLASHAEREGVAGPEDRGDAERLDFLEREAEAELQYKRLIRDGIDAKMPDSLFRRNNPITRAAIDAAMAQQEGKPT